jgi:hypothetical protein
MPAPVENGIIHMCSSYAVSETVTRLESVLASLGLWIFARIDRSGEGRRETESDPADYLRDSEERHSGHDCHSDAGTRSPDEGANLGRERRQALDLLQKCRISPTTASYPGGISKDFRGD